MLRVVGSAAGLEVSMCSTIIVTGANDRYEASVASLLASIRRSGFECDFGIIDAGLSASFIDQATAHGWHIRPVELNGPLGEAAQHIPQGWKAALLKPHIRDLFPGYETYIFLDADTWVQHRFALDYLKTYSSGGRLAVVSQRSRFHDWDATRGNGVEFNFAGQPLRANWYTMFSRKSKLPKSDKRLLASQPILNAGVFALQADAALWDEWQGAVIEAANALPVGRQYAADQVGLGLAVYRTGAALSLLPETCNWMSVWRFDEDRGLFTQTQPPFDPVGIIHLAGISPDEPVREVALASGASTTMDLGYDAWLARQQT